ncbi:MAG: sensor histidine kinase [Rhodocyclaceae bacterium]|nr:sensor histidine kinase [Rhodocyclaceae bacterium]
MGSIREKGRDAGESRRQKELDAESRGQSASPARLPDFRNMGVWLRILLAVNLGALAAALARNRELAQLPREFAELAAFVEPVVLGSLTLLGAAQRRLERLAPPAAMVAVVVAAMAVAQFFGLLFAPMFESAAGLWRPALWAALAAGLLLAWFDLRWRAHSPAVTEARLMALTARIRPHFFFNSLNAVLGVIRSDPRRAEAALEELSDLFRVLMRDSRELVPLSEEIALARQYLELEKLRLGDRLRIRWDIESCPPDALVPPLMLQPLLENAVYHGIERLESPGEIAIRVSRQGDRVAFELTNPYAPGSTHQAGNRMALANIRERLMLFFDLEAQLETAERAGFYVVSIAFPYRRGGKP